MSEKIDEVSQQIEAARLGLRDFEQALASVDAELNALSVQRSQYGLLQQAVDVLQQLHEQDAATLFWGEDHLHTSTEAHIADIVGRIASFDNKVGEIQERRQELLQSMGCHQDQLDTLAQDLYDLEQQEESKRQEWLVEREASELPKLAQIMPWMRGFEEDQRFRKTLGGTVAASLILGLIIPFIDIPIPDREELIEVPERFVQLIQKQEQQPLPPPRPQPEQPPETKPPKPEPVKQPKQKPPKTPQKVAQKPAPAVPKPESTRERVASKGILAFRESFSNLADSKPSAKLGAKARINNSGQAATGRPERNMVTTKATGSSGGINLAALSRDVGDGGGGAMEGVLTTQVASSIAGAAGTDRPLSDGAFAGRTDEEIQIVFDRYKAALYRLYNRELRKDPTLRGQLVLQLTIEPDGTVSLCSLKSSSMEAPQLAQQVVSRVSGFNFGAKDVPTITIVYPIDFLPAA